VAGYGSSPRRFAARSIAMLEGIGHQIAIAIENARLYEATLEQERTAQELHMAQEIQVSFLPAECPSLPGWEISADWQAAREVGGDFYDFVPLDAHHMGVVIADVSDKGMPAALFMSLCRTLVRVSATETPSPAAALQRVNELLVGDNRSAMFCTAFYGVLDWRSGQLTFANAGHNPPILRRRAEAGILPLTAEGIVLGVLEDVSLEERQVVIQPGDLLILYTDGVTEPINGQEEEFGHGRLIAVATEYSDQPCARIVEAIHAAVSGFVGAQPQFDDYTLVALKRAVN
jgi:sigma-B regulation protein RsbU (phosphoserine phosphatase)